MRMTEAVDLLFITINQNVSFMGKTWWALMLVLRLLVLLPAGFTLFGDEQERFVCNTIQPGCSNLCFDAFAPVSVLRLWLLQLVLLCLPHVLFAAYVLHRLLSSRHFGASRCDRGGGGGSPLTSANSGSSREPYLHKAPMHDLPRFYCAYSLAVILRIFLEVVFGTGQFLLFGLSFPKSFLCREAPCTPGVECYISRPTEKTLMLRFMLGVASLSVLLSAVDLLSSVKAMVRWRRKKEMLMEEMSRGEQISVFTTTTTMAEDGHAPLARRISPGGSSADASGFVPTDELLHTKVNSGPSLKTSASANEKSPESSDPELDATRPPAHVSTPAPAHFVLHGLRGHPRPPLSPRPDGGPLPNRRAPVPMADKKPGRCGAVGANADQQSDSGESQDKRAWV